ncbi:hypothetical protein [Geomonas agri]|uniref:hypothetical protein n=1 Tax=Geomonas agri TaxID=2873702 RepID=UPI001CD47263|nr:hypothetical protein [Geomonas agri]
MNAGMSGAASSGMAKGSKGTHASMASQAKTTMPQSMQDRALAMHQTATQTPTTP